MVYKKENLSLGYMILSKDICDDELVFERKKNIMIPLDMLNSTDKHLIKTRQPPTTCSHSSVMLQSDKFFFWPKKNIINSLRFIVWKTIVVEYFFIKKGLRQVDGMVVLRNKKKLRIINEKKNFKGPSKLLKQG